MLDKYFIKPTTVDRVRASWLGEPIERYVIWLHDQQYSSSTVARRVPVLLHFAEFAWREGARCWSDLPVQLEPFIRSHIKTRRSKVKRKDVGWVTSAARVPVAQMLSILPIDHRAAFASSTPPLPFNETAPRFFIHLQQERGLSKFTIDLYVHNIRRFETYLRKIDLLDFQDLTPVVLGAYVADCGQHLGKSTLSGVCSHLRIFLRYLFRERLLDLDLAGSVDRPRVYRLATVPRSITWDEVGRLLESIDQRSAIGKRDYAIMLLLVTYGLRAREVAALKLDDIDWERERLQIPDRKGGHNTAFPLSTVVGEAIVAYLRDARPVSSERTLFLRAIAPVRAAGHRIVSLRAAHYLRRTNITVPHPGSHTLRHTCVQRLVDAHFPLKTIGDYVGHARPISTQIYAKVDVEGLREMAMGDGEDVV